MSRNAKMWLFWSPRLLCIAFAGFLGLFALDVFGEHLGFWRTLLAFVMHLRWPAAVLLVLALAWKWEWVGTLAFTALGVLYAFSVYGRLDWILIISGPMFLLAALFLVNWLKHDELHKRAEHPA
jgi:hypothetical protein